MSNRKLDSSEEAFAAYLIIRLFRHKGEADGWHVMDGRCTGTLDESEEVSWPAHQVLEIILGWSDRSRSERNYGSLNQISQSIEFKALRKPPNALSRQGSVSPAAFEASQMGVRLVSVS